MFELKPGQGVLHRAEKAKDTSPDYTGRLNLGGTEYRMAGWIKQGKNGKWMSLSVDLPRTAQAPPGSPSTRNHDGLDDIDL